MRRSVGGCEQKSSLNLATAVKRSSSRRGGAQVPTSFHEGGADARSVDRADLSTEPLIKLRSRPPLSRVNESTAGRHRGIQDWRVPRKLERTAAGKGASCARQSPRPVRKTKDVRLIIVRELLRGRTLTRAA